MKKQIITIILLALSSVTVYAQDTTKMTTKNFNAEQRLIAALSEDGKIYIVIAIISIILVGLFFYLFKIDKKITKLEQGK